TSFVAVEGEPHQVAAEESRLFSRLQLLDLQALPASEREGRARALATDTLRQPFQLASRPLLRAQLLRLDPHTHLLLLALHHLVPDGWSLGVLLRELNQHYAAYSHAAPLDLPDLPIQYADYALWQREWLAGAALQAQLAYWRTQLAGAPPLLELPTDRPRPPVQTFDGAVHTFALPAELTGTLQSLSRRVSATLFMVALAGIQALLARYSQQEDLLVGTPIAGRTRAELEPLIGCFVNTLVLRGELA